MAQMKSSLRSGTRALSSGAPLPVVPRALPGFSGSSALSHGISSLLPTAPPQQLTSAAASALRLGRQQLRTVAMVAAAPPAVAERKTVLREAHGFVLDREEFVKEYDSQVLVYKHKKTGAELISVLNADENKTFGIVFRTPVADSTGIPHILEHSVLCGSRKYPIKEPFVELMKGSLNTFLNAFTYPDRTCYPVASTNTQDFYNLVDVYLDAVFFPRCINDRKVFEQEGWHYELNSPEDEMTFKGVVFNEMKGVYSSPDSVFYRELQRALFPDTPYSYDSGGDPAVIPQLTFEQFQQFHARYYHPSNSRIWFYGDDDQEKRLQILDSFLSQFEARPVDSLPPTQPLRPEPRTIVQHYAAGDNQEDGGEEAKAYTAVSWVLSDEPLSTETELALGFLDYLMLGTPAAPLRKALNDSSLGAAVIGGGIDDELKQPVFALGLKGVDPANVPKVEQLILAKLEELAKTGFTASAIEAAINTTEFSLRENNTGSYPRGLSLMLRALGAWIYDRDPLSPVKWEDALGQFKARLASGEDVFGPLIHKYLLDNKHRVTLTLLPDTALAAKIESEEKGKLDATRKAMKPEEVEEVVRLTSELKELQETPDSPEALACVPGLKLSDIPSTITKVPTSVEKTDGASVLRHELFTNNVLYLEAALDLSPVPRHLLPLVPLFCRSLTQMGTATESFVELTERIGRKTGGLSVYTYTSAKRGAVDPVAYVMVRGKAMGDKAGDLLSLVRDILLTARLDDRERFTQMVAETKAGLESAIVASGHSFASKRLTAQRSAAGWLGESLGGLTYLESIRGLAKRVESDWEGVKADLHAIRDALLSRQGALVNLTADERSMTASAPHVAEFLASLPASSKAAASNGGWGDLKLPRTNEALVVPTQVNYVGKAANLYEDAGYTLKGSSYVVEKYLGTTWLWDRVRVVGGAYGGFCSFDPNSGMFQYLSYRDPNLADTLKAYDGSPEFLRTLQLDSDALTKAIIGTIGDVDAYQLPDAKGYSAMGRYLLGVTDAERQQRRDEILGTTLKDFKEFAEVLESVRGDAARVVAVTSPERAKAINDATPGFWEVKKVL